MPSLTRRQALAALGAISAGLAGCASQANPSGDLGVVDGEWPMVGREPGQTRWSPEGPIEPETVWTTELEDARAAGTPSVADSRIYVPVDAVSDRDPHRHHLYALEAGSGEERWRIPLRSGANSPPVVHGSRIVLSVQTATEQGRLVGFDERDGAEEWLYDIDARVTAPPTVDGAAIYVPDWGGSVHALSAFSGSLQWAHEIDPDDSSYTFAGSIAVHDGTLYLGSMAGETGLVAVDAETGDLRWFRSTAGVSAGPVVDDGLVVVQGDSLVHAFDTDGTERWTFNVPGDRFESPLALDENYVYVPMREALYAITRDGEAAWTTELATNDAGPPTISGEAVLVTEDGQLRALDRSDGTTRWSVETDGRGDVVTLPEVIMMSGSGGLITALGEE
ncbi:PQQ-binding-like beta-propeller repeat protein [Halostagnicola sp. A-GB9-2]|uniref:outer membrane protein assembly factor BamB family protein n=1 Tax=Halostagnicola sp. A-GB9-2 TaxID=3048066 RepID=UPI0024C07061|nr:PQQ-binding-like beta-propeller repeat protein [Halostagnicola sp. A-GB9-2]MDJ1432558.1 PQQ-binding-like beta-propeller repeat protein [Halostagnicola sp. A-GB9-2]